MGRTLTRICRKLITALIATTIVVAPATVGSRNAFASPSQAHHASINRAAVGRSPWYSSQDVIYTGSGDEDGYHLYKATEQGGWSWEPLASLAPAMYEEDSWTGYQCTTGSGDFIIAVVAPKHFVNDPVARDRGALAYAVNVHTRDVQPLLAGVALKYFNPGCGLGDTVALAASLGEDQAATEIAVLDASSTNMNQHYLVPGQVSSPVPVGTAVVAARGRDLVSVGAQGEQTLARLPGQPYMLRVARDGVDFLVADSDGASAWTWRGEAPQEFAEGALGGIKLFQGVDGQNVVVGAPIGGKPPPSIIAAETQVPLGAIGASLYGRAALYPAPRAAGANGQSSLRILTPASSAPLDRLLPPPLTPTSSLLPAPLPPISAGISQFRALPLAPVGAADTAPTAPSAGGYTSLNGADEEADGAGTPAKCAVPRNHDRRQVPQPSAAQIDWAIQQATRNLLTGTNARPANYLNTGLAAYSPSSDFPRRQLHGTSSSSVPVPPSAIQATFAQESAWKHASFHALPGVSGNPLVSDYYGAAGTLDRIDYANADCGYGLSQVTDPMTKSATAYSANGKTKVALDYAENAAAGIQFLVDKWNELYDAGVLLNNGDPKLLENWYFAFWAYNTGFHPNDGSGPWGLGWTNNPINSDYPPDRQPFLRTTYADAEHPADWPYQERVFGWMETPIVDYKGNRAYAGPIYKSGAFLNIPSRDSFCNSSNDCSPSYQDPSGGDADFCTRADRKCWWHNAFTFVPDCANQCAESGFTYSTTAPEPAGINNYPPACNSSLSSNTVIVDDLPNPALNVEGCNPAWQTQGTFEVHFGAKADGDKVGIIDWHQLGVGFGGHIWFSHNRSSADDTAHINQAIWTPPGSVSGLTNIKAHIPSSGATTSSARYVVDPGNGVTETRIIDQHLHENRWVSLGNFNLSSGASVSLSNRTDDPTPGTTDVAFDAMAFTPVSGNAVSKRIDAVAIFDSYQDLDTDSAMYTPGHGNPFTSMASIYQWARNLTLGVGVYLNCLNSAGRPLTRDCVGDATSKAYRQWDAKVSAAGDGSGTAWDNETLPLTQADWLEFSNPRAGSNLTAAEVSDPSLYKTHLRMQVDFVASGGQIDPNSVALTGLQRVGDTHLPGFILDIMKAYQSDYGVAPPDLSYSAPNLHIANHAVSSANPGVDGIAPGGAYMGWDKVSSVSSSCVEAKAVGGGVHGYRPMLANDYVGAKVNAWVDRVADVVAANKAPEAILDGAKQIRDMFFHQFIWYDWWNGNNSSLFYMAPPIWIQLNVRVCADGTVSLTSSENSWMPDMYVYVDRTAVNLQGQPVCGATVRACSVRRGDFLRFSHLPTAGDDPWDQCDFSAAGSDRNGNPWNLIGSEGAAIVPDHVRFCDETQTLQE